MNIINYDFPTWYEWATYNWGTKSNAEDAYSEGDEFFFETELTPPYLVYRKLDELFPDLTIEYSCLLNYPTVPTVLFLLYDGTVFRILSWKCNNSHRSYHLSRFLSRHMIEH